MSSASHGPSRRAVLDRIAPPRLPITWTQIVALTAALLAAFVLAGTALAEPVPEKGFELDTTDWQPAGITSDGVTLWVADALEGEVLAYTLSTGARDPSKDIDLDPEINGPSGLWVNSGLLWIVDGRIDELYVYSLVTGARIPGLEFELSADQVLPRGLWSDGRTLWVLDAYDFKLYAYAISGGERKPCRDIALDPATANPDYRFSPRHLWSDGETIWVSEAFSDTVYAYALVGGTRLPSRDLKVSSEQRAPTGIWSDGATMWVADAGYRSYADGVVGDKVYAYDVTALRTAPAGVFTIYYDPSAGPNERQRYRTALGLLKTAGIPYTEVTGAVQGDVNRLAGVSNSVMPRFFLGDPTAAGWVPQPKSNNGGLRWLRGKVAELSCGR